MLLHTTATPPAPAHTPTPAQTSSTTATPPPPSTSSSTIFSYLNPVRLRTSTHHKKLARMWIFGIATIIASIIVTIYLKNHKLNIFDNKK